MTGYYLELGYNSALGAPQTKNAWTTLKAVFQNVISNPDRVLAEVLRLEPAAGPQSIREMAEWYTAAERDDLTFKVVEKTDPDEHEAPVQHIYQYASGGGPDRYTKESVRRAVCRLVIEDMHRLKIEVNLRVS